LSYLATKKRRKKRFGVLTKRQISSCQGELIILLRGIALLEDMTVEWKKPKT
jgi:hypothetical protein